MKTKSIIFVSVIILSVIFVGCSLDQEQSVPQIIEKKVTSEQTPVSEKNVYQAKIVENKNPVNQTFQIENESQSSDTQELEQLENELSAIENEPEESFEEDLDLES